MEKKLYLIETVSIFRHRYVVEAKEASHAEDEVVCNGELEEFSQKHIDENIISTREITPDEYIKIFDVDNDYLKDWTDVQKMQFINVIDYKDE